MQNLMTSPQFLPLLSAFRVTGNFNIDSISVCTALFKHYLKPTVVVNKVKTGTRALTFPKFILPKTNVSTNILLVDCSTAIISC